MVRFTIAIRPRIKRKHFEEFSKFLQNFWTSLITVISAKSPRLAKFWISYNLISKWLKIFHLNQDFSSFFKFFLYLIACSIPKIKFRIKFLVGQNLNLPFSRCEIWYWVKPRYRIRLHFFALPKKAKKNRTWIILFRPCFARLSRD